MMYLFHLEFIWASFCRRVPFAACNEYSPIIAMVVCFCVFVSPLRRVHSLPISSISSKSFYYTVVFDCALLSTANWLPLGWLFVRLKSEWQTKEKNRWQNEHDIITCLMACNYLYDLRKWKSDLHGASHLQLTQSTIPDCTEHWSRARRHEFHAMEHSESSAWIKGSTSYGKRYLFDSEMMRINRKIVDFSSTTHKKCRPIRDSIRVWTVLEHRIKTLTIQKKNFHMKKKSTKLFRSSGVKVGQRKKRKSLKFSIVPYSVRQII